MVWNRNTIDSEAQTRRELEGLRQSLADLTRRYMDLVDQVAVHARQLDGLEEGYTGLLDATAPDAELESGSGWSGGEGQAADYDAIREHLLGRIAEFGLAYPGVSVVEEIVRSSQGRHVNAGYCYSSALWPANACHPFGSAGALMYYSEDQSTVWMPTTEGPWLKVTGSVAAEILSPRS